jgi:hypothetical protein
MSSLFLSPRLGLFVSGSRDSETRFRQLAEGHLRPLFRLEAWKRPGSPR